MSEVKSRMTEDKLQLNDGKTEAMLVTSRRASTADSVPTSLRVVMPGIKFASQVKNLGVSFDCYLTLHQHVTNVCTSAHVEVRCIAFIRQYLSCDAAKTLISAFVFSRLDYCNSLLAGAPENLINKLKRVQNAAARLVATSHHSCSLFPSLAFMQYHVGFSTRSHLCVIAPFLKVVPGICHNDCIDIHPFVSFAHLLTALRFVFQPQTERPSENGPSFSLATQSGTVSSLTFAP